MSLDQLKLARKKIIGTRETIRALEVGEAAMVFVARDADEAVTQPVVRMARERGLEIVLADTMRDLGRACGIEVGAASAAIPVSSS